MGCCVSILIANNTCLTPETPKHERERRGSMVECLTRDRGVSGSSLTGVTELCP